MQERRELIMSENKTLKLGWVVYELMWPVVNDMALMFDSRDGRLIDENTYWMDGSRKNLELRFDIGDRVRELMNSIGSHSNDLYIELMYKCRDECNSVDDIMEWEMPEGGLP